MVTGNLKKLLKEKELYVTSNKAIRMYFECIFIVKILSSYVHLLKKQLKKIKKTDILQLW